MESKILYLFFLKKFLMGIIGEGNRRNKRFYLLLSTSEYNKSIKICLGKNNKHSAEVKKDFVEFIAFIKKKF